MDEQNEIRDTFSEEFRTLKTHTKDYEASLDVLRSEAEFSTKTGEAFKKEVDKRIYGMTLLPENFEEPKEGAFAPETRRKHPRHE